MEKKQNKTSHSAKTVMDQPKVANSKAATKPVIATKDEKEKDADELVHQQKSKANKNEDTEKDLDEMIHDNADLPEAEDDAAYFDDESFEDLERS